MSQHPRTSRSLAARSSLIVRLVSVLGAVIAACAIASSPAEAATFQITNYDNDGTHGVYLRSSSDVNNVTRDSAHYVTYGTNVNLVCGLSGSSVGSKANTAWDYVQVLSGPNAGRYGYISEHWVNTPVGPNQHVAGEPSCGATAAPAPTSTKGTQAAAWARSQYRSTAYKNRCLSFARQAWAAAGVNLYNQVGATWNANTYPADIWNHLTGGTHGTGTPPAAGAILFYSGVNGSRTTSHVTVFGGGTQVISTDDYLGSGVHYETLGSHARYLGWWLPAS